MPKSLYEKPLLFDLQRNEALFGYGTGSCNPFGDYASPGACNDGNVAEGNCHTGTSGYPGSG